MDDDESFLSMRRRIGFSATDQVHMNAAASSEDEEDAASLPLRPISLDAKVSI